MRLFWKKKYRAASWLPGAFLHGGVEIGTQNVEHFHFGGAIHADGDGIALADAHARDLAGAGEVRFSGAHLQSSGGIGIALGDLIQTAGEAEVHTHVILDNVGKRFHIISSFLQENPGFAGKKAQHSPSLFSISPYSAIALARFFITEFFIKEYLLKNVY